MPASTFPGPGEVFREYFYHFHAWSDPAMPHHYAMVDPHAGGITGSELREKLRFERPLYLTIPDLKDAVRAEMVVEFWGGHIGSTIPGFRVNGSDYLPMPDVFNTPGPKEAYYRFVQGSPTTPIPLELLREGVNEFRFAAGPQVKFDFKAGFYWLYSFGVRVYYDSAVVHPTVEIISPRPGQTLGDESTFEAVVTPGENPITQVDFVGNYRDLNWSGNGLWQDWHFQYHYGTLERHIGTAPVFPWRACWHSAWVPDQEEPFSVVARVVDASGLCAISQPVDGLTLKREDRSVKMYVSDDVPEKFGSRIGERKSCNILLPDPLEDVYGARLALSTWCGGHNGHIYLNDQLIVPVLGKIHDIAFDRLVVPPEVLRQGKNVFSVQSDTDEHAVEINWPGPALLVQYNGRMPGLYSIEE